MLLKIKFYVLYMSQICILDKSTRFGRGVRSDPSCVKRHHFFIFGPMGPPEPNFFLYHFGYKKLGKVIKFYGCNFSRFLMRADFRQGGGGQI